MSKQALDYYYKGKYPIATELYRRAYALDPSRPEYLYGAARSEHKAGHKAAAVKLYEELLQKAPPASPHAVKARHHLANARAEAATAASAPGAATRPAWQTYLGRGLLAAGGAAVVVGAVVGAGAVADNSVLDDELAGYSAEHPVTSMTWDDARRRRLAANSWIRTGWVVAGMGTAAAGVAVWMLLRRPAAKVAVAPAPDARGLLVAVQF